MSLSPSVFALLCSRYLFCGLVELRITADLCGSLKFDLNMQYTIRRLEDVRSVRFPENSIVTRMLH